MVTTIKTLNGKIELSEHRELTFRNSSFMGVSHLYISCKNDRDSCNMKLNREQATALIKALEASLLW